MSVIGHTLRRRWSTVITMIVVSLVAWTLARCADADVVTRVSVRDGGGQISTGITSLLRVSADGRYVVFSSDDPNIVSGDTNGLYDVFVHDRTTHSTVRASVGDDGAQPNQDCGGADITPDGRYVCFESGASNLVAGDTNSDYDVFVRDLVEQRTTRVSLTDTGLEADGGSSAGGRISADGRYVVFRSSNKLVPIDTNGKMDIYLRDLQLGTTTLVSISYTGAVGNGECSLLTNITPDGRYIVFLSEARNLVSGVTIPLGQTHVFVRDMMTGTTSVADLSSTGVLSNTYANASPSISNDGRYVSFHSKATNLVPDDTNGLADIFVRDRQDGVTTRVSVSSLGEQGTHWSVSWSSFSADGRFIAFCSYAPNLVPNDTNGLCDAFVHDRLTGRTRRVSVAGDGTQANGETISGSIFISSDGNSVTYESAATNMVAGDTNGIYDVFVYELRAPTTPTILTVSPALPVCTDTLTATAGGSEDGGQALTYHYQWARVSAAPGASKSPRRSRGLSWGYDSTDGVLRGVALQRGEVWAVHAYATDGEFNSGWTDPVQVTVANAPPSVPSTLVIEPTGPLCSSTLTASAEGATDADGDTGLTYEYQWAQWDGAAWGAWGHVSTDGALTGVTLHKGERWAVKARAHDGADYGAFVDPPVEVTIGNSRPTVPTNLTISPAAPVYSSTLSATAEATDPDEADTVTYKYQWCQKGAGDVWGEWGHDSTDGKLTGVALERGQVWGVRACATDGALDSDWTALVQVTIGDAAPSLPATLVISPTSPVCTSSLGASADGATDPDGDTPVTYKYQWAQWDGATWGAWGHDSADGALTGVTLHKAERWAVRARATDGTADGEWTEPVEVTIGNTAPTRPEWVRISPAVPGKEDLTGVAEGSVDADDDGIAYEYQWAKLSPTGEYLTKWADNPGEVLSADKVSFGDTWQVRARAFDGTDYSLWKAHKTAKIVRMVSHISPGAGAVNVPLNSPIYVSFRWPVNQASVNQRLRVYRGTALVHGSAKWVTPNLRVRFTPTRALTPGTAYEVRLASGIACTSGRVLGWGEEYDFQTAGAAGAGALSVAAAPTAMGAQVSVNLSSAATVRTVICNMAGRVVAELAERELPAGVSSLVWNGRGTSGTKVPAGTYLVRVEAKGGEGAMASAMVPLQVR